MNYQLSPMLFDIALERVIRDLAVNRKINLGELVVLLLVAYADNIVIMGNSRDDVTNHPKMARVMGLELLLLLLSYGLLNESL